MKFDKKEFVKKGSYVGKRVLGLGVLYFGTETCQNAGHYILDQYNKKDIPFRKALLTVKDMTFEELMGIYKEA